jgi:hypothetical protein
MSDALYNQITAAFATVNDSLTSVFGRDNAKCFLLKRDSKQQTFTSLSELTSGYFIEYGQVRDDITLNYSTTTDEGNTWAETTHIAFGVPDGNSEIYLYEIVNDQKDGITPNFLSSEFRAFASRVIKERYAVTTGAPDNALTYNGDYLTYNGDYLIYTV